MANNAELQNFIDSIPDPDAPAQAIVNEDEPHEALGIFEDVVGVQDEFSNEAVEAAIADGPMLTAPDLEGAAIDPTAWLAVGSLPGYAAQGIRAYGRPIFLNFPCFREHADKTRRIGRDRTSVVSGKRGS